MIRLSLIAMVSVLAVAAASGLSAQMGRSDQAEGQGRPERPVFSEADTDESGTLSIEEMAASHPNNSPERISEVFTTLDTNGDGALAYDEYYRGRSRED